MDTPTPELAPLAPGRWQVSKKRMAEVLAHLENLRAEWEALTTQRWPLSMAHAERFQAIDREIGGLELLLFHQAIALKQRAAKKSGRARPVDRFPRARPSKSTTIDVCAVDLRGQCRSRCSGRLRSFPLARDGWSCFRR